MRVIEPNEPIEVKNVATLIYGDPGSGKTSLGNMTREPMLIDFDRGAHRSANRGRVAIPDNVPETIQYLEKHAAEYGDIVIDTVGRLLDMNTADIAKKPKMANSSGGLSPQGWGVLRDSFLTFKTRAIALQKDLYLLAHAKEEKDDDQRIWRPDIQGGSQAEILKACEFAGYLTIKGGKRIIQWSQTDRNIGKDPAGWGAVEVPHFATSPRFLADLIADGKAKLGQIDEKAKALDQEIAAWRVRLEGAEHAETLNLLYKSFQGSAPNATVKSAVWALFLSRSKALGFVWSPADKTFSAPVAAPEQAA